MAKLDPLTVFTFMIQMAAIMFFVIFVLSLFFSTKVAVRGEDMERFVLELADALASSELTAERSVYDAKKLTAAEGADPNRNTELYARNCEFGYTIEAESLAGKTVCKEGSDCRAFCGSVCGLEDSELEMSTFGTIDGNCGCNIEIADNNFCQCKKNDEWQSWYAWEYGYKPTTSVKSIVSTFPALIDADSARLQAKTTLAAHDSFLTRIACAAQKAYETRENVTLSLKGLDKWASSINRGPLGGLFDRDLVFRRTEESGTHVCLYKKNGETEEPFDCRYMPGVPVELLDIKADDFLTEKIETLVAYPLKAGTTCYEIKSSPDAIAGRGDNVETVLLCLE